MWEEWGCDIWGRMGGRVRKPNKHQKKRRFRGDVGRMGMGHMGENGWASEKRTKHQKKEEISGRCGKNGDVAYGDKNG